MSVTDAERLLRHFRGLPAPGRRSAPLPRVGPNLAPNHVPDPVPGGDHVLNGESAPRDRVLRPAAVLIPIIAKEEEPTLLLTKRTQHLRDHAGQISFPGGRVEPEDVSPEAAALREAEEEIDLKPEAVQLVGRLDTYVTGTGFEIVPVVGLVSPPLSLRLDPEEVEEIFEVPLGFFLTPASRQLLSREFNGRRRHYYAYPYGDYFIWGATAGMLNNLAEVLARLEET